MIKKTLTFILFYLAILVVSCNNTDDLTFSEIDSSEQDIIDTLKNGKQYIYFEGTEIIRVSKYLKNGWLHGEKIEYFRNGNVKEISYYDDGYIVGDIFFYNEDGSLRKQKELIKYYDNDTPFVNTWIVYDSLGLVVDEESYYYSVLNSKDTFLLNEEYEFKIQLFGSFYNDQLHITVADFDDEFNILGNKIWYTKNKNSIVHVPIATDNLGENNLKFIINDYTYVNIVDSLVDVYQILVDFNYFVKL